MHQKICENLHCNTADILSTHCVYHYHLVSKLIILIHSIKINYTKMSQIQSLKH